jgi:hypothetical protein
MRIKFDFGLAFKFGPRAGPRMGHLVLADNEVRRMGWNDGHLMRLNGEIEKLFNNFEKITKGNWPIEVIIRKHKTKDDNCVCELNEDNHKIFVFLKPGPENVLRAAPLEISHIFADCVYEYMKRGNKTVPEIELNEEKEMELIERGIANIKEFLAERGLVGKKEVFEDIFHETIENLSYEIVRRKIAYELLRPHYPIQRQIEDAVDVTLDEFERMAQKILITEKDIAGWRVISSLAMLGSFAKKAGFPLINLKCYDSFHGEFGYNLAMIGFAELFKPRFEYFQKYPLATEEQLQLEIAGFGLIYNTLQPIIESAYDNVKIKL